MPSLQAPVLPCATRARAQLHRVFALSVVLTTAGCSQQAVLRRLVPPETDRFARAYVEAVRTATPDAAVRPLTPRLAQIPGVADSLARVRHEFAPGTPDSVALVAAQVNRFGSVTRTVATYQLHAAGGWTLAQVVVAEELGVKMIDGVYVQRLPGPPEQLESFTLAGKGVGHLLFLAAALASALFSLWAAVRVARTPMRRRWAWALVATIGLTKVGLNWTTGETFVDPFSFQLLCASAFKLGIGAPWVLAISFPAGALVALDRRRRALTAARASAPPSPADAGTQAVPPLG